MSSTFYVYARKGDTFVPLFTYNCSSDFFRYFESEVHIPYEKIAKMRAPDLENIERGIRTSIENDRSTIAKYNETIAAIGAMPNPISEKLEQINEYQSYKQEYEDAIKDANIYLDRIVFLRIMVEDMDSTERYCDIKDLGIYVGIDSGYEVTVEDII